MDLNTIREVKRPTSPDDLTDWLQGYAWLAGGTWLFSEPQLAVDTLIDLETLNWRSLEATSEGLEIAATCRIGELEHFLAPAAWTAAPLLRECCHALLMSFKIYNEATVAAISACLCPPGPWSRSRRRSKRPIRCGRAAVPRARSRQSSSSLATTATSAAGHPHPDRGTVQALRLPPRFAHPPWTLGCFADRYP